MARELAAMSCADVLIVEAGHAGAHAAIELRRKGYQVSIVLLSAENELPYERLPLSKSYLAGETSLPKMLLRPESFWGEKQIDLQLGAEVVAIDASGKTARPRDGDSIALKSMIWAAGGAARRVGGALSGMSESYVIRCRADFDRLRSDLGANTPGVAIIGAGYIGLEAAAVLSERGCRVSVIEVQDRPLARVAGEEIAAFYQQEHEARGVAFHFGVQVGGADKVANGLCALRLLSGARVQCDLVIEGIGIVPAIGPLCEAGAAGENGIRADDHCRTSLPDVYANGDCAEHHNRFAGGMILRLESVQNTVDMAAAAAANIWRKPRRIGLCLGSGPTSMISDFRL
ncbi:FAD-dependent oxidoreductase [Sphingopyxis sp.]|uniref:NAD(P)/FAD-dependent oxidoreductase n=1 Tax=Sphingopyxis sp. TaxID=1908224 RepID=UPI001DDBC6C7|nr:FAD-dependent oxidoreductase [Sphingopyxis sp.]MBW8297165.1 FAD-dependent oxidoreductase [Sphingopyxis sp.]